MRSVCFPSLKITDMMKQIFTVLFLAVCSSLISAADSSKPNFVVFLVDDLGWGDLGCYGSTFHETPHLDGLATDGMRFTQAYSACTVCSPSRAAIMTGQYPARLHLTDWIAGHRRPNPKLSIPDWNMRLEHSLTTLPEALKAADYRTQFIGKWHLMPIGQPDFKQHYPDDHGFDSNIAGREWGQPKGPGLYFAPFGMPNLDDGEPGDFLTDNLTDAAVDFIDQSKDSPFLLYFSYYTVHGPIMAKPELVEKYTKKAETFQNTRNEKVNPRYAGMIESLDDSVGRILEKLDSAGLAENTVVIFTADNGGVSENSSGGLRGCKALAYEGGTREPFIVRWPSKVKPDSTCDVPIIGNDIYPTILDMAELDLKPGCHIDGLSLVPVLTEAADSLDRDSLYWHYPHYHKTKPYGAVREGDWKLIEFFEDSRLELYDLKNDPSESIDLAAEKPDKAKTLLANLQQWRAEVGAQMPTENPDYDPNLVGRKKARGKPNVKAISTPLGAISASSAQQGNTPGNSVDGSKDTRWAASGESLPQWIQLDLGGAKPIKGVDIHFKNRTWIHYQVDVSNDGKTWSTAHESKTNQPIQNELPRFEAAGRYLRVTINDLGKGWATITEWHPVFE